MSFVYLNQTINHKLFNLAFNARARARAHTNNSHRFHIPFHKTDRSVWCCIMLMHNGIFIWSFQWSNGRHKAVAEMEYLSIRCDIITFICDRFDSIKRSGEKKNFFLHFHNKSFQISHSLLFIRSSIVFFSFWSKMKCYCLYNIKCILYICNKKRVFAVFFCHSLLSRSVIRLLKETMIVINDHTVIQFKRTIFDAFNSKIEFHVESD